MSTKMNEDKMKALAAELAKDLKTPEDLSAFSAQLTTETRKPSSNNYVSAFSHQCVYVSTGLINRE